MTHADATYITREYARRADRILAEFPPPPDIPMELCVAAIKGILTACAYQGTFEACYRYYEQRKQIGIPTTTSLPLPPGLADSIVEQAWSKARPLITNALRGKGWNYETIARLKAAGMSHDA